MLYLSKDGGSAVGEIVAAIATANKVTGVDLCLTNESLTASIRLSEEKEREISKSPIKKTRVKKRDRKAVRKQRSGIQLVEFRDKTLSIAEWSKRLGVSDNTVRYRVRKTGNPYGYKGPTDKDKIVTAG